jgi:hypothetical protein
MPEEKQGKNEKSKIPALRTLKTESAEFVRNKNISLADMALAESKKRREGLRNAQGKNLLTRKRIVIILGSAVLAAVVGFSAWFLLKEDAAPQTARQAPPPLIFSEQKDIIEITKKSNLKSAIISKLKNQSLKNGEIKHFAVLEKISEEQKQFLNARDFLTSITNPPSSLIRALSDKFYFGIIRNAADNANYPILIFEINSFDQAFAGMLSWERTLKENLMFLMPAGMNLNTSNPIFTDEVIKNHDVRLIKNEENQPILLYTFFSKRTLVITFDQKALEKTLERLEQALPLN